MLAAARSLVVAVTLLSPACACRHAADPPPPPAPAPAPAREPAPLPSPGGAPIAATPGTVPGEYLVSLAPGAGEALVRERFGSFGIERVQPLGRNVFLVKLRPDPGLDALERARSGEPRITAVQPNFAYGITN